MTSRADRDPMVQRDGLLQMAAAYLAGQHPRAPLASPIHADLRGSPPLLVHVGTAETLLDDATRLAERARAAGVAVDLEVWDDMIHVWHAFAPLLPEADEAIARIGTWVYEAGWAPSCSALDRGVSLSGPGTWEAAWRASRRRLPSRPRC